MEPAISSGVLTSFLTAFATVLTKGFMVLKPAVLSWLAFLVMVELTRSMAVATIEGTQGRAVIRCVLRVAIWTTVIVQFPTLADVVVKRFVAAGLAAGGGSLAMARFMDPGSYLEQGFLMGKVLNDAFTKGVSLLSIGSSLAATLFFMVVWIVFVLCFAWMGICVLLLQIEFALGTLGAVVLLPAIIVRGMGWMATGALAYPVNCGFKFFLMALVASIVEPLTKDIVAKGASWESGLVMLVGAFVMAYLFHKVSGVASGILSGSPQLSVSGLVQTLVLGASVLTGGAATGAALGQSAARTAAILINNFGGNVPVPGSPSRPPQQVLLTSLAQSGRYMHGDSGGHGSQPRL